MPSVKKIKVTDPISEEEMSYKAYMYRLSANFKEMTVNFSQEQYMKVFQAANHFQKRIREFRSVCSKCHVSEWSRSAVSVKQFFVNDDILEVVQDMKKDLATGEPSPERFWENIETIGIQSCKKCHLVHQSLTLIQQAWEQPEN
jgi:nitrate/TMAO reductase-like tetraheme cytochrome c subunit